MDTEMKWAALAFLFILGAPMLGLGLSHYQESQCRISAMQKGIPTDDIIKLCKV